MKNTQLEMQGKTSQAEGEKDAIIKNATSIINGYKANFFQNMNVDNDQLKKNLQVLQSFNASMAFTLPAEEEQKRQSMFKMLQVNNQYGQASDKNVVVMGSRLSKAVKCIDTSDGLCAA